MSALLKDAASGLEYMALGETKKPQHIIVVLHGTGDNCRGIEPLGDLFVKSFENTLVLIPNGPVSMAEIYPPEQIEAAKAANPAFDPEAARNWAGAAKTVVTDEESMARAVDEVMTPPAIALNTLIDGQMRKYGLDEKNLVIYGFSAGGLMALHTAIAHDKPYAGVVSHSGHFLGADQAASKPKVLMIFGDQEMATPQINELFTASAENLRDHGLSVEVHVCKDLAHGINQESFETARNFIGESLGIAKDIPLPKPSLSKPPKPRF